MQFQVIVSLFSGLKPLCLQFSVDESDPPSLHDLRLRLSELLSIAPEDQRITTEGGRSVEDDAPLFNHHDQDENVFPPVFNLLLRLPGGKGGFGSMLRAQGGKMASQKTSNFEACRDLSGRRLKTVNDAKKLADYLEKEPERKRKRQEEIMKKIEDGLKEPEKQKIRFHDPDFVNNHEKVMEDVQDAVERALKAAPAKAIATRKPPSPPAAPIPADLSQWDVMSDPEESEDEEEEDEEEDVSKTSSAADKPRGQSSATSKGKEVEVSA